MISIRLLESADASAFKALRLVAIDASPTAIWPTRAEEAARSIEDASLGFETFGVERRAMRVGDRFYDEQHMVRMLR
ncbi:hypothetical protein [Burkholderia mayonis]|uniref:Acetyltransferase n=1 Tax=Burkholderia mayonis TaxID=1385591 RepID=A0A1B4FUN7_9BURK|nr:hypothetical protein [Burkholderia mayonis]AOJ07403.1 hypothetical protein WS71_08865 [Burkholderia mayonis]KVE52505.1 hypothetical protein WS71_09265 [Burkholderia mayonis]